MFIGDRNINLNLCFQDFNTDGTLHGHIKIKNEQMIATTSGNTCIHNHQNPFPKIEYTYTYTYTYTYKQIQTNTNKYKYYFDYKEDHQKIKNNNNRKNKNNKIVMETKIKRKEMDKCIFQS